MNGFAKYAVRHSADQSISSVTPCLVRIKLSQQTPIVDAEQMKILGRMSADHAELRSIEGAHWTKIDF